jgi:hypothetical protein
MSTNPAFLLAALALLSLPTSALAASPSSGHFGVGLGGGLGISGLSGKYYVSDKNAVQAVVGIYGLGYPGGGLSLSGDYLFEMPPFLESDVVNLGWNVGAGGWGGVFTAGSYGGAFVGVSGVAGLEFLLQPLPFDVVLEYRPSLMVVPGLAMNFVAFDGHIRFYF